MRIARLKIKRTAKVKIRATQKEVRLKFPKQSLGTIGIYFQAAGGSEILV